MERLETISAELVTALRHASDEQRHAVGVAACEFAINRSDCVAPVVLRGLDALRSARKISDDDLAELDQLVEELDEEYFNQQEMAEESESDDETYMRVFEQARSVAALAFASRGSGFDEVAEAVYEAAACVEHHEELFQVILPILEPHRLA